MSEVDFYALKNAKAALDTISSHGILTNVPELVTISGLLTRVLDYFEYNYDNGALRTLCIALDTFKVAVLGPLASKGNNLLTWGTPAPMSECLESLSRNLSRPVAHLVRFKQMSDFERIWKKDQISLELQVVMQEIRGAIEEMIRTEPIASLSRNDVVTSDALIVLGHEKDPRWGDCAPDDDIVCQNHDIDCPCLTPSFASFQSHLQAHMSRYPELADVQFGRNCRSMEAITIELVQLDLERLASLATLLQNCISNCRLTLELATSRLKLLQDVCATSLRLPESYWITNVKRGQRIAAGGEATVYGGTYRGQAVVIREFHPPEGGNWHSSPGRSILKLIIRESIAHWQLKHENIVVFMGVHQSGIDEPPAMILRRAKYGSAGQYLEEHPGPENFLRMILGITNGLAYLHSRSPPVIHGDLHMGNLLVDEDGVLLLCDFGLSRIRYEITRTQTAIRTGGRPRYLAPELTFGPDNFRTDEPSDVYSFAMTIYALGTHSIPFNEFSNEYAAAHAAQQGHRPAKPAQLGGLDTHVTDDLWDIVTSMWTQVPSLRPSMPAIQASITSFIALWETLPSFSP